MFVAQINIGVVSHDDSEAQHDEVEWLLGTYRMDGHVLGRELPLVQLADRFMAFTLIPAEDAFEPATFNKYINERIQKLTASGLAQPVYEVLGKEPSAPGACDCKDSSAFVLFTTYVNFQSPLRCADCFLPIPLYHIPRFPSGDFHEVISWQSDYQSCDRLQMNCSTGERFATHQISSYDSSLSRRGRGICKEIERLTGKVAYYYLYRGSGRSYAKEVKRKCPNCDGEWFLDERWHELFNFRCDRCYLTSNIAWDVKAR